MLWITTAQQCKGPQQLQSLSRLSQECQSDRFDQPLTDSSSRGVTPKRLRPFCRSDYAHNIWGKWWKRWLKKAVQRKASSNKCSKPSYCLVRRTGRQESLTDRPTQDSRVLGDEENHTAGPVALPQHQLITARETQWLCVLYQVSLCPRTLASTQYTLSISLLGCFPGHDKQPQQTDSSPNRLGLYTLCAFFWTTVLQHASDCPNASC